MTDDMQREAFEREYQYMDLSRALPKSELYGDPRVQLLWSGWCAHIRYMREQEDKA